MAPLQHHFELKGWAEVTIVVRFWIVAGLSAAFGLRPVLRRVAGGVVRAADLAGSRVLVAGLARSGLAACQALVERGAIVAAVDGSTSEPVVAAAAKAEELGVRVELGAAAARTLPDDVHLLVTSPGWPPHAPLLRAALERGPAVWGEVELAWRLRAPDAAPWLVVTGTNGKTTTTRMLESMLRADGRRCLAVGNIGVPLVSVVTGEQTYDVLAVELGSPQLHSVSSVSAAGRYRSQPRS